MFKIIILPILLISLASPPIFFASGFDIGGLENALSHLKGGSHEQCRAILIPYIKYAQDRDLSDTARLIYSMSYFYDDKIEVFLCLIKPSMNIGIPDEIKSNIAELLGEIADNIQNYPEEALEISLFILEISPDSKDAFFRVGYIYYKGLNDLQNAYLYFTKGLRQYPLQNYKGLRFLPDHTNN